MDAVTTLTLQGTTLFSLPAGVRRVISTASLNDHQRATRTSTAARKGWCSCRLKSSLQSGSQDAEGRASHYLANRSSTMSILMVIFLSIISCIQTETLSCLLLLSLYSPSCFLFSLNFLLYSLFLLPPLFSIFFFLLFYIYSYFLLHHLFYLSCFISVWIYLCMSLSYFFFWSLLTHSHFFFLPLLLSLSLGSVSCYSRTSELGTGWPNTTQPHYHRLPQWLVC